MVFGEHHGAHSGGSYQWHSLQGASAMAQEEASVRHLEDIRRASEGRQKRIRQASGGHQGGIMRTGGHRGGFRQVPAERYGSIKDAS